MQAAGPAGPQDAVCAVHPPLYVAGPDGPWEQMHDRVGRTGRAVVHTTWGVWLAAALLDPRLRTLLGRDFARFRQTPDPARRLSFAMSRYAMKYTAAAALEVPAEAIDLTYRPGGQPGVRGWGGRLALSLAHTDDLLVVGVSRTGPIGVDVENARREISTGLLLEHVCTPAEALRLAQLPEPERSAGLLRLWTLKEAYTKALGYGLRRQFSRVGFRQDGAGRMVLAEATDAREWDFCTHLVHGRYVVSQAHRPRGTIASRSCAASRPLEETGPSPATTLRSGAKTSGSG
ncbi:4'-phosphopantetheinyl transferase superfamily protein [Streptomyces sp. NPDC048275]|uniref:4'-phosphopantetheinyl transferase family protein n=1 Tax=Streptomyces sp. NPDC048275 TaxID=3155629 RepID=UPI0033D58349